MSGGFFRGTSAAQDTRFSNKQAKLMKSQKFHPELEHLVDISKVKMDVMKPWIATRVTEFLGFEDEVLINFIYGLLDGKEVNGKEVQIQLTGFMEKNTGKFMKELWTLLLSAQHNSSGVPQQFLDAKEEETRKKKAETDRIADEISKKEFEKKDSEPEKRRKLEDEADIMEKDEPRSKHQTQESSAHFADEEISKRNGSRGRSRSTRSRSVSMSVSNSRSYSGERQRPRNTSRSPQPRGRSISSDRKRHSRLKRSLTPPRRLSSRRSRSPLMRKSSNSRQRSSSRSRRRSRSPPYRRLRTPLRRRSRSPVRSRSPIRRRSRTPARYRSRSPIRRRSSSPVRSRSASPVRRRSPPVRRRSPSPVRRRSPPVRRRSPPVRRRSPSPYRRRSPSPVKRRSISPPWHRSRSPVRRRSPSPPVRRRNHRSPSRSQSPIHYKSSVLGRRGSPSPPRSKSSSVEASSQSPVRHMSKSPTRKKSPRYLRSPVKERETARANKKLSPQNHKGQDSSRNSLRSPQRNVRYKDVSPRKAPAPLISPDGSPSRSGSSPPTRRSAIEDQSPHSIPVKTHLQRPETGAEVEEAKHAREDGKKNKPVERQPSYSTATDDHKKTSEKDDLKGEKVIYPLGNRRHTEAQSPSTGREGRKNRDNEKSSSRDFNDNSTNQPKSSAVDKDRRHQEGKEDVDDAKGSRRNGSESNLKSIGKIDEKDSSMNTSGMQESDKRQRKHGKSKREVSDSGDSFDSETGRKEAKRRRKEEKKQRKEERRKRKEDRRSRRREERSEEKKKKLVKLQPPSSDNEDTSVSDFEHKAKRTCHESDGGMSGSEQQKKLEIELRNRALESLEAKKRRSVH